MKGKIVVVTGATSGIGLETAKALAAKGAKVVITARGEQKGKAALDIINGGATGEKAEALYADLSSLAEARKLASEFAAKYPRLDVLVNNAGGMFEDRIVTADGFEHTFALNVLAPFVLTLALLPQLKAAGKSRVVNVSSMAHMMGKIDLADLMGEKRYSGWKAYSQAKLALLMQSFTLSENLKSAGVTVNALHPGVVRTNFMSHTSPLMRNLGGFVFNLFAIPAWKGALTSVFLAASEKVEGKTGKYWHMEREMPHNRLADDVALRGEVWKKLEQLTGITF